MVLKPLGRDINEQEPHIDIPGCDVSVSAMSGLIFQ